MTHDYADVEIFVRPQGTPKRSDTEWYMSFSFEECAMFSNPALLDAVSGITIGDAGTWEVGWRKRGDELYTQSFEVFQPHAEEVFDAHLKNHLAGVLTHVRG